MFLVDTSNRTGTQYMSDPFYYVNTFSSSSEPSTPMELSLLVSLRILGRDWKLPVDDFHETIGVSFCEYGAAFLYEKYLYLLSSYSN